jgi:hypothetical protein
MGSKPISRNQHLSVFCVPRRRLLSGYYDCRQTPVFMRVRRTAPSSTFNFPERFVNGKPPVFLHICRQFVDFYRSSPFFFLFRPFGS